MRVLLSTPIKILAEVVSKHCLTWGKNLKSSTSLHSGICAAMMSFICRIYCLIGSALNAVWKSRRCVLCSSKSINRRPPEKNLPMVFSKAFSFEKFLCGSRKTALTTSGLATKIPLLPAILSFAMGPYLSRSLIESARKSLNTHGKWPIMGKPKVPGIWPRSVQLGWVL